MATEKQAGGRAAPDWASRETTKGIKVDSGPYIGIIKNNVDPSRQGRLEVWIPELGGKEESDANWYTVSYASPFFGSTQGLPGSPDGNFGQQTYGFWAVPPDINNRVLVTFVMGDASKGYWFACIPNIQTQQMVPAVGRPANNKSIDIPTAFGKDRDIPSTTEEVYLPASEVNLEIPTKDNDPNYLNLNRQVLTHQANIVIQQGLETDPVRGTVTSSSQRETPSQVVGLSSPGRTSPDTTDFSRAQLDALIKQGKDGLTLNTLQSFPFRKGGHSFVMDDGDIYGDSQLVRLRSAGGHQILMNDTANVIYISNSLGTNWVELTPDGSINIYSGNSVNIRSEMDLNFHADGNVNMHAGDTIRMYAGSTIHSQTKTQLITADDLYNINAGVVGIRVGGNMNINAISADLDTSGNITINSNSHFSLSTTQSTRFLTKNFYAKASNEMIFNSVANSGWKVTDELWLTGSKVYLNTSGKVVTNTALPMVTVPPNINPDVLLYKQQGVNFDNTTKRWRKEAGKFESVAPFTPTHEPWTRASGAQKQTDGTVIPPTIQNNR
jgi:hypothetical protein